MFFKIAKILFKENYPIKYNYYKDKQKFLSMVIGISVLLSFVIIIYGVKVFLDYVSFSDTGETNIILTNTIFAALAIVVVSSTIMLIYVFNYMDDYTFFLSLPIKMRSIVWGKIVYVIMTRAMLIIPFMLIPLIIYGGYSHLGISYWFRSIFTMCFLCVVPIVLIALIIFCLIIIIDWKKIKDYISALIHILIITAMIYIVTMSGSISSNIIGTSFISTDSGLFKFLALFGDFITGKNSFEAIMIFCVGFFAVALIMCSSIVFEKSIERIIQKRNNANGSNRAIRSKAYTSKNENSPLFAMIRLDLKAFFNTPDYVVNNILMMYAVVIALLMMNKNHPDSLSTIFDNIFSDNLIGCLIISFIIGTIAAINSVSLTPFTRDSFYYEKTYIYPIDNNAYILSKVILNIVSSVIQSIILLFTLNHISEIAFSNIVFIGIHSLLFSAILNYLIVLRDFRNPKRNWHQPYEAVKISLRMLSSILLSIFLGVLPLLLCLLSYHLTGKKAVVLSVLYVSLILVFLFCNHLRSAYVNEKKCFKKNEGVLFSIVETLGIYYILQFIIPCFFILMIPVFSGIDVEIMIDLYMNNILIMLLISQVICSAVYFIKGSVAKKDVRIKNSNIKYFINDAFIGLAIFSVVSIFLTFVDSFNFQSFTPSVLDDIVGTSNTVILFSVIGVTSPIIEELIFREIIYSKLKTKYGIKVSNLIQAILFGVYHLNILQALYGTFCGIVLGKVREKRKSIIDSCIVHISFNSISLLITKSIGSNKISVIILSVGLIVTGLYSLMIYLRAKKKITN